MAVWSRNYTIPENVNGGQEYKLGDQITDQTLNVPINNILYIGEQLKATAYSAAIEYKQFAIVGHNGSSYMYINNTPTTGNTPPNATYWQVLSAKGDTGATGATGNGIVSIAKTGTTGYVDTYTITYSDNSTTTFTITNANIQSTNNVLVGDGIGGAVDSGIPASTILNTLTAVNPTGNPINIQNTNDGFVDRIKILNETVATVNSPLSAIIINKNIFDYDDSQPFPTTFNGITFSKTNDVMSFAGTLTSGDSSHRVYRKYNLPVGTYALSGISTATNNWQLQISKRLGTTFVGSVLLINRDNPTGTFNFTGYDATFDNLLFAFACIGGTGTVYNDSITFQLERNATVTDYTAHQKTTISIPLTDTSGTTLDFTSGQVIEKIGGKYFLDSTELSAETQTAIESIPTYQGQTNLFCDQAVTFDITEFQLGLESLDAMLTLPNGKRVNVITKDRLIFIASGEHKGKTLDYVLQEMQNDIAGKANDIDVIKKTGDQTKAGVLTFSSSPIVPNATTSSQAVNKGQLDNVLQEMQNDIAGKATELYVDNSIAGATIPSSSAIFIRQPDITYIICKPDELNTVYLPFSPGTGLEYTICWHDGTPNDTYTSGGYKSHYYGDNKLHLISIIGNFGTFDEFDASGTQLYELYVGTNCLTFPFPAFAYSSNLEKVMLPEGMTHLGSTLFHDCSKLKELELPLSLTTIGDYCLWGTGLEKITIPSNVTTIGNNAFRECFRLTSITVPSSVSSIGEFAFANCTNLRTIEFQTLTAPSITIGANCFIGCRIADIIAVNQTMADNFATVISGSGGTLMTGYRKLY